MDALTLVVFKRVDVSLMLNPKATGPKANAFYLTCYFQVFLLGVEADLGSTLLWAMIPTEVTRGLSLGNVHPTPRGHHEKQAMPRANGRSPSPSSFFEEKRTSNTLGTNNTMQQSKDTPGGKPCFSAKGPARLNGCQKIRLLNLEPGSMLACHHSASSSSFPSKDFEPLEVNSSGSTFLFLF